MRARQAHRAEDMDRALSAVFEGFTGDELYVTHDGQPVRVALKHSGSTNTELGTVHWYSVINDLGDAGMYRGLWVSHSRVGRDLTQSRYEVTPRVFVKRCRIKGAGCHEIGFLGRLQAGEPLQLHRTAPLWEPGATCEQRPVAIGDSKGHLSDGKQGV